MLLLFGLARTFRIALFVPEESWTETASVGGVPGSAVVGIVAAGYAVLFALASWPRGRQAKGERREGEPGRRR